MLRPIFESGSYAAAWATHAAGRNWGELTNKYLNDEKFGTASPAHPLYGTGFHFRLIIGNVDLPPLLCAIWGLSMHGAKGG